MKHNDTQGPTIHLDGEGDDCIDPHQWDWLLALLAAMAFVGALALVALMDGSVDDAKPVPPANKARTAWPASSGVASSCPDSTVWGCKTVAARITSAGNCGDDPRACA